MPRICGNRKDEDVPLYECAQARYQRVRNYCEVSRPQPDDRSGTGSGVLLGRDPSQEGEVGAAADVVKEAKTFEASTREPEGLPKVR